MSQAKAHDEQALMKRALLEIRELRARLNGLERAGAEPIAVIGMACRFPGAPDPAAFWELLAGGGDAITEVPKDRWDVDAFYDPDPEKPGKMYTRWGGFLRDVDGFSPAFFGISPREAASMDPQQRLLLEVSWEALENAAAPADRLQDARVGVFVGIGATDYSEIEVLQGPAAIDPYNGTGTAFSVASGRLSYLLGVRGPSFALDTACSSSLAAVHLAAGSLRNRESDVALAGGVNLIASPESFVSLCKARMLSPDGRCKTFDAAANGYVRSEGCGVLVLKRLPDALAANDNVLAVIRGSAVNHNGRSSGLTVPSGPAQQALVRQALQNAALEPADVGYVEAHGTGTAVGDPIEVGALAAVFAGRARPLLVGSVKSNVGHLEWAAGVCGLIKVILSMRHGSIPASLHVRELNPLVDWAGLPLSVVRTLTPWPAGPRRAGVSSFGFGGTNAHVVLEEPPAGAAPPAGADAADRPLHVLALSAKSPEALRELAGRYARALDTPVAGTLADFCHTANAGRSHFEYRRAAAVATAGELRTLLQEVAAGGMPDGMSGGHAAGGRPKVALLFTGQGSQYAGMGRALYASQPAFRRTLERCGDLLRDVLDLPLLDVLYPPASGDGPPHPWINQTAYTQPALFAVECALAECWQSWGIRPHAVVGHSTGEFVAACVAGVFSAEDGLRLVAERARLMQALPPCGSMVAVRAPEETVARVVELYRHKVSIAAVNGPREVVISGDTEAVRRVVARLEADGVATQPLTVSHAFHSPLVEPVLADFERVARSVSYRPPRLAMISTVTGRVVGDEVVDPAYWVRHIRETVRFRAAMAALQAENCDAFLEVGPKPVLLAMGRQCVPDASACWLPSLRPGRDDWRQMLESLAELYARGADVDWAGFDGGYRRRKVELPTYPFQRQRYPVGGSGRRDRTAGAARHLLVETVVRSPLVRETVFATALSTAAYPYLADHRIFGEVVVPAGGYLAMLLNGARRLGRTACRLEDVYFVAPLVLPEGSERTLQSVLDPEGAFRVISFAAADSPDDVTDHVRGRMIAVSDGESSGGELEQARARCTSSLDPEVLAAGLEGIEFGPGFRWIHDLRAGHREAVAHLRLPETVPTADGYWVHPGLLDACFQVTGATLPAEAAGAAWLPFAVKSLEVWRPAPGTSWWCHAAQCGDAVWDVRLFDESGAAIAEVRGFEMRKAPREAFQGRRTADWVYRLEWQRLPADAAAAGAAGRRWLIVANGGGLGDELARRVGRGCVVVAGTEEATRAAVAESPDEVVYFGGTETDSDVPAAAGAAAVDLLHLARALGRDGTPPRLWLVTAGSQAVSDADRVRLAPAPVWGLGRTLQLEAPALRCRCVDLPARPAEQDVAAFLNELANPSAETQVAFRAGERFVARLVRHRDNRSAGPDGPFRLQLAEYGSPEQLRLVPMTRRPPGPGEVEIEVKAAALNFRDVLISLGMLRDFYAQALQIEQARDVPLGFDCAGTVVATGEGVTDLRPGDAVMTSAAGSSASYLTVLATDVVLKPANVGFEAAAALPTAFLTAHICLLQRAGLKAGQRVLIHAAAGGVGQAAVQLAQAAGAEVFATASPAKWDVLKDQGVRHVLNSRTADFADEILRRTGGEGVDVVLNSLTGEAIDRSFAALKPGGVFAEIGKLGVWTPEQAAARRPDVTYFVFDLFQAVDRDPGLPRATLGAVREWIEAGRLHPLPHRVFPAREAVAAYRFLQQARQVGKVVLSLATEAEPVVRGDGSYLITGGLGGLGIKVAEYLADRGARRLVLAGRSEPAAAALEAIARLRARGASVDVVRGDVGDPADAGRMIAACPPTAPLRGVVHAAGVLDDGVLEKQTAGRFARVLAPKVRGGWNLHTLSRELPLDFFVCFSSMASALGSAGQSNYAAANAFLDGLAHHRRALGLPALTINWGPWDEVGMAAGLSLAGQGVEKVPVEDGLDVFGDLLRQARGGGPAQLGVWRVNWQTFRRQSAAGEVPPVLGGLVRTAPAAGPKATGSDEFLRRFHATPAADRAALLETAIQGAVAAVLGLRAAHEIPPTRLWADLGLDSLMTVDLRNRLEATLRIPLPVEKLMRDVDARTLAAFALQKLSDAGPPADTTDGHAPAPGALSDDDVQQLALEIPQMFVTADGQRGRQVLVGGRWRHDFASCNYLGLDLHPDVMAAIPPALAEWGVHPSWTRAVASPRPYADLERELAAFVGAPTTLVFPSISLLHAGVLPTLAGYDGVILKDTEAHHTIHEGCLRAKANGAEWANFPHGDVDDLAKRLARVRPGRAKVIATDGVYSMGSSHPPLADYARLAKEYDAVLYVDDAHGFGVIGERPGADSPYGYRGNGMVRHLGLDYVKDRIVYVAGLSKAFSSYAAFVTCFDEKMKWDLQGSGPFVFSGPTCVASLASALAGLRVNAREGDPKRRFVYRLTHRLVTAARDLGFEVDNAAFFPVVGVVMGNFDVLVKACKILWDHDVLVTPAIYPAVPLTRNLVRFSVTAANTEAEVEHAVAALRAVRASLFAPAGGSAPAAAEPALAGVS